LLREADSRHSCRMLALLPLRAARQHPCAERLSGPRAQSASRGRETAIVNAIGPIRQLVQTDAKAQRHYLVIVQASGTQLGAPVQVQVRNDKGGEIAKEER
jgi:hypothetical protein